MLGGCQFHSSHGFEKINVYKARKIVFEAIKCFHVDGDMQDIGLGETSSSNRQEFCYSTNESNTVIDNNENCLFETMLAEAEHLVVPVADVVIAKK